MNKEIRTVGDIRLMVDVFYEQARKDELLAPIFLQIKDSTPHKEMLYQYWERQIFRSTSDQTEPFPDHISLMFSTQHFIRWLRLFLETIDSLYSGPMADQAKVLLIRKSEEFQTKLELLRF